MKQHWLGVNFGAEGHSGNEITKTNIPDIRVSYRYETLVDELSILCDAARDSSDAHDSMKLKHKVV